MGDEVMERTSDTNGQSFGVVDRTSNALEGGGGPQGYHSNFQVSEWAKNSLKGGIDEYLRWLDVVFNITCAVKTVTCDLVPCWGGHLIRSNSERYGGGRDYISLAWMWVHQFRAFYSSTLDIEPLLWAMCKAYNIFPLSPCSYVVERGFFQARLQSGLQLKEI